MHDISQRADMNRMSDYNLAVVLTPNLVKGSNPIRDVAMCAAAGAPAFANVSPSQDGKTTLGSVIALCIRRYYEVFDETPDHTEAAGAESSGLLTAHSQSSFLSSQLSPASTHSEASYVIHDGDDDDFGDDDLPSAGPHQHSHRRGDSGQISTKVGGVTPPSAWATANAPAGAKRHRPSGSVGTVNTIVGDASSVNATFHGRAKSLVSIDKASLGHKKGTISIGRGTTKKGSGAAVGAVGVTAEGFFSPPKDGPALPPRPVSKPAVEEEEGRQ